MSNPASGNPCVGIIANPVSARDVRRVIANASTLQLTDRVNIILRALATLRALGVAQVLMMPDKVGISSLLLRGLARERTLGNAMPEVTFLTMEITSSAEDTRCAVHLMRAAGVCSILVLGGDGTHRAVVRELYLGGAADAPRIPIAGLSTGTNNAFPEMRESTVTALAVGLHATSRIPAERALAGNKLLEIDVNGGAIRDIAIVDAAVAFDRFIGARAMWKPDNLHSLFLAFGEPTAVGLSAIGGLLQPVSQRAPGGLAIRFGDRHTGTAGAIELTVPFAPGLIRCVRIAAWAAIEAGQVLPVDLPGGSMALDGERELVFAEGDAVTVTLRENAFPTVDVPGCLHFAAQHGLFRHPATSQ